MGSSQGRTEQPTSAQTTSNDDVEAGTSPAEPETRLDEADRDTQTTEHVSASPQVLPEVVDMTIRDTHTQENCALEVGDMVEVFGLTSDTGNLLNGWCGRVEKYLEESDQFSVAFTAGLAANDHASLERHNLLKIHPDFVASHRMAYLWQFAHHGWHSFSQCMVQTLEDCYDEWIAYPQGSNAQPQVRYHVGSAEYRLDFPRMVQTNLTTRKEREVRRVRVEDLAYAAFTLQSELVLLKVLRESRSELAAGIAQHSCVLSQLYSSQAELSVLQAQMKLLLRERDELIQRNASLECDAQSRAMERDGFGTEVKKLEERLASEQVSDKDVETRLGVALDCRSREIEVWRCCRNSPQVSMEDPTLKIPMTELLRKASHPVVPDSRCNIMQNAEVVHVCRIVNTSLWTRYLSWRQKVGQLGITNTPLQPAPSSSFQEALPWVELRDSLNEVLLFHGCNGEVANIVMEKGFDPSLAAEGCLYGRGTYFTDEACKSMQYARLGGPDNRGCILLCRVVLGDPEYVTGARRGWKQSKNWDPSRPCKDRYDGFVVNAGCHGGPANQVHREFVIFSPEQVYPELAIYFKV